MTYFQYDEEILNHFPNIVGGVLVGKNIQNQVSPEILWDTYLEEQQKTLIRIGDTPLSELESLKAWRAAFRNFGVNPTKYRSAAESLLRRLTKKGDIPSINAIVDICNLVSIRHGLPVAAFDTRHLKPPITVRFANGNEHFTPLFAKESEQPDSGEVIFIDKANLVVARRWCWRQSDESATNLKTREAIFTIEAHHDGSHSVILQAVDDLQNLLSSFVGGEFKTAILNTDRSSW